MNRVRVLLMPLPPGLPSRLASVRGNVAATRLLLDAIAATSRCHVVFASSAMITGLGGPKARQDNERVTYAESKPAAGQLAKRYRTQVGSDVSLRLNTLGGPRIQPDCGVVAVALRAAQEQQPIPVYGTVPSGRAYLHVLDSTDQPLTITLPRGGTS